MVRRPVVRRPIPRWPPPSAVAGRPPGIPEMETEWTVIKRVSETPAVIPAVTDAESIGKRPRIIVMPIPGPIVIPSTVNDDTVMDVTAGIPGCIAYINDVRCRIVNVDVRIVVCIFHNHQVVAGKGYELGISADGKEFRWLCGTENEHTGGDGNFRILIVGSFPLQCGHIRRWIVRLLPLTRYVPGPVPGLLADQVIGFVRFAEDHGKGGVDHRHQVGFFDGRQYGVAIHHDKYRRLLHKPVGSLDLP